MSNENIKINLTKLLTDFQETMQKVNLPRKCSCQSWGGAGVQILDINSTSDIYMHPSDLILRSRDFKELANLYDLIKESIKYSKHYNHLRKIEIWHEITITLIKVDSNTSLEEKVKSAIQTAINLIDRYQTDATNN
jgi:hypothetical protein